jgi:Raf kinase inhibitor-like YbhB/YbcL family protein
MRLSSRDFGDQQPIPEACAFGRPGDAGEPIALAANRNPQLAWSEVPEGTRSFVLTCIDPDAPSVGDDVNQPGRSVAASLERVDFVHWLMADIPADCRALAHGSCSDGGVAHGKRRPEGPAGAKQGRNDYTLWFRDDAGMAGDYLGYDGPCPPWNDERVHRYEFRLYALDVEALGLAEGFTRDTLRAAMGGRVLAEALLTGTYTLNPSLLR